MFNVEQREAIFDRGRDLLVSASAGTGKTAVLIERVCTLILEDAASIDEFLIVTFTEAAARELKTRIYDRLQRALEEESGDLKHLSTQISLLPSANISTIHGFCKRLIEENVTLLGIEPDVRVADNSEMSSLQEESFEQAIEEAESREEMRPAILAFAQAYSDDALREIVMNIFREAAGSKDPVLFLESTMQKTLADYDVLAEIRGHALLDLERILGRKDSYYRLAEASGFDKYLETAKKDLAVFFTVEELLKESDSLSPDSYQAIHRLFQAHSFEAMPAARGKVKELIDPETAAAFKDERDAIKAMGSQLAKHYFLFSYEQLERDMENARELSVSLLKLTALFTNKYAEKKRKNNLIDFDDMQHFALKVLDDRDLRESYQRQLKYLFIDEFQDTSDVQDAIISRLKSEGNYLFIVGDYKQSIYAFRKARPELFLQKYDAFAASDGAKTIELNENFRSMPRVLSSVNDVFERLMSKSYGGIDYAKTAMLKSGKKIADPAQYGQKSYLRFLDTDWMKQLISEDETLSTDELTLKAIIRRIKEIRKETYPVFDEAGKPVEERHFTYGDICILSRSPNRRAAWIKKVFEDHGIPLSIDIEENLFEVPEILVLIDFLNLVSNPKNDMALLSVMRSAIGQFTDDELFVLSNFERRYYADFLCESFATNSQDKNGEPVPPAILAKLRSLSEKLERFRTRDYLSVRHRLGDLLQDSKYLYHCLGKRGAYSIYHALQDFLAYIDAFERSGKYGLYRLLEHFDEMRKRGGVLMYQSKMQNESESVKLLSIHKSKGLQFKYVILQDMQKSFNKSHSDMTLISDQWGLVSKNVYREQGIKHSNPKFYIEKNKKLALETLEEMRLLYVAMTRAEHRLELFAKVKAESLSVKNFQASERALLESESYLSWILHALSFCGILSEGVGVSEERSFAINENWTCFIDDLEAALNAQDEPEPAEKDESLNRILQSFSAMDYPVMKGVSRKTVSQLKERENRKAKITGKASGGEGGTERGNAYHKFMQVFLRSRLGLEEFLELNRERRYLSEEELKRIELSRIRAFCEQELYQRILDAKQFWTEKPFVYKKEIDGEEYHLQGIIDLAFLDRDDKLVVLDFKTDRLREEAAFLERYGLQLELYSEAIAKISGYEVKESLIYSFEIHKSFGYNNLKGNVRKGEGL